MRRIVLLPGLDGTGTLFEPLVRCAPPGLRSEVVALPPVPLGYEALAAHLAERIQPDRETVLLAESFSGPLAVALAARFSVAGVVLCNSFVVPPRPRAMRALAVPALFRLRPPIALLRHFFLGPDAPTALVLQLRAAIAATPPTVLASRVASLLGTDAREALLRSAAPLLYLRGTADRLVPESSAVVVAATARGSVSIVRLRGPHLLLQVAPAAAWRAIESFITRTLPR